MANGLLNLVFTVNNGNIKGFIANGDPNVRCYCSTCDQVNVRPDVQFTIHY